MAQSDCDGELRKKPNSTLPPPCYHCRPMPFCCPKNGCPPQEPCPLIPRCPAPCLPLIWRTPPEPTNKPKPTLCIARPCPQRAGPRPFRCPPKSKIQPPPSTVTFAIRYTCEGPTYCPCYSGGIPNCGSKNCC